MAKSKKTDKEKRIDREIKRLTDIFADLDENKRKTIDTLIDRAAFITVSLQDIEEELKLTGWTELYQNGKYQTGVKKSAAADVHISLTKNLNTITKQLLDLVPQKQKKSRLSEMMDRDD